MWGEVNERPSKEVRPLIEKCWAWQEFRRTSTAWDTKMVSTDPRASFFRGLSQKGSGHNVSKVKGLFPCHRVQLLSIISYESMVIAMFWVNGPREFLLFSYVKGEPDLQCPSSGRFIKLSLKFWKTMSSNSSHKNGLELLLLSKTYQRFAQKREIWNAVSVITN